MTVIDRAYELEDRYRRTSGRVYLTGSQALVRAPMVQRERDVAAGLNTAGFISGYPGSPLGGLDQTLRQATEHLARHHVHFQPGVNEDIAATSVWGSQNAPSVPGSKYDGVFAMWYGKGPGVDRSVDAIKHGAYHGASAHGGVLVLAGDDHGARSSTIAHQSEHVFVHCGMPVLNPAGVQEYIDYAIYGWAMSRFSGCWIGFPCVTDTVESGASVSIDPRRIAVVCPEIDLPPGGLNLQWGRAPQYVEGLVYQHRLPAAQAFARANNLDKVMVDAPTRRLAIVTTGKSYLDVRSALDDLGIDDARAASLGVRVFKVAMSWPLEPQAILEFVDGHDEVLVVEEKRSIVEEQLARLLVNRRGAPLLTGKVDEHGRPLVPSEGELAPASLAKIIGARLLRLVDDDAIGERLRTREKLGVLVPEAGGGLMRLPSFCSGCPHNTSTKLPDGSFAFGGIGCHGMAVTMPDRATLAISQMGGEGAGWIGIAPFTETPHMFQNLGDGTYFHSGLLCIRAAVAAGVNITYKILVNDKIAMTGGQSIQGQVDVPALSRQVAAEGVARVAVVSDDPTQWKARDLAPGATVHHRDDLDRLQRELREVPGTTVIIYEQECATELRRKRKRGLIEEPDTTVVINERVCEGCGDCSVQSNCISIEPIETAFGRKRSINQSTCNKDYSCLKGYCPSFITLRGARRRPPTVARSAAGPQPASGLPDPVPASIDGVHSVLVAGIGGTGVVTIGALLGMAAHLEGRGVTVLDVAGLAQKNGPVTSHIRIGEPDDDRHAVRIPAAGADVVIAADLVVACSADPYSKITPGRTRVVANRHVAPTADFARNPDLDLSSSRMGAMLRRGAGESNVDLVDATALATALLGDAVFTNAFLLGIAYQHGWLPVSAEALSRAIELNGVAVDANRAAFGWGRTYVANRQAVIDAAATGSTPADTTEQPPSESLDDLIRRCSSELVAYQDAAYAERYRALVDRVTSTERRVIGATGVLSDAVARSYYKLLAYKDEYEVARLLSDDGFWSSLGEEYEPGFRASFNLAPQLFNRRDPATGRAKKREITVRARPLLRALAAGKRVRGTRLDLFGRTAHRRGERALIVEYEATVSEILASLTAANLDVAAALAAIPDQIRGYDTVKDAHVERAKAAERTLLDELRGRATAPAGE